MAVTEPMTSVLIVLGRLGRNALLRLLGLGRIEQRRDDSGRADAHRDTGLDQFGAPFFVPIIAVAHRILFLLFCGPSYALGAAKGRAVR